MKKYSKSGVNLPAQAHEHFQLSSWAKNDEDNNIDAKSVSSLSDITDDGTPSRSVSPKSVKNTTLHGACRRSKRQRYQTREHVLTNMTPAQQKTWEKAQLESLKAEKQRKRRKLVVTSDEENSGVVV